MIRDALDHTGRGNGTQLVSDNGLSQAIAAPRGGRTIGTWHIHCPARGDLLACALMGGEELETILLADSACCCMVQYATPPFVLPPWSRVPAVLGTTSRWLLGCSMSDDRPVAAATRRIAHLKRPRHESLIAPITRVTLLGWARSSVLLGAGLEDSSLAAS